MTAFMSRFSKCLTVVAIILVSLLILSLGCGKKDEGVIKIGVIAPLTGPIAPYGENIKDGVMLAVDEINEQGGVKGKPIRVIFEDEGKGPEAAVSSVRKLITIDHVSVIIGPATSNGVMAAAPLAESYRVVLFSPSGTSDNISDAGDYIFRNRATASQEASVFAEYIAEDLGIEKYAILRSDADYAISFADVCNRTMQESGGQLLLEETFSEGSTDYRSQLSKIKSANPEGIFIVGVPIELGIILKQIKEIGLKAQLFSNTIDSPEIFDIAEGSAEGLTFVTTFYDPVHGDEKVREFDAKFREEYGRDSHIFGANAYDAVYILKTVIEQYGNHSEKIKDGLYLLGCSWFNRI